MTTFADEASSLSLSESSKDATTALTPIECSFFAFSSFLTSAVI